VPVRLPGWRMSILQVLLATVDVATTATIFHSLLPASPGLTYLRFLGVYIASYTAGLAASLPGGLGVFDTAMLLGLSPYMEPPQIVGAIVVYRLCYYVIPLFLAGIMFAGNEILLRGSGVLRAIGIGQETLHPVTPWSEPDFAVAVATGLVALCGAMLLMLGVLAPSTDYSWLDPEYADLAFQAGQYIPSLIGAGLVVMALALSHRVNLAWGLTILLLIGGAGFAATQDSQLWVVVVLVLCAVLLAPFRSCFYRRASLLSGPFEAQTAISLIVLVICVLALAVARHKTFLLSNNAWWAVVMSPDIPNSVRFAVAVAVVLASVAIWLLVRPGRVHALPWDASSSRRLFMMGAIPPVYADGMVTGETDRAGLPFRRIGRVLLGLGDPAGAEGDKISAVWRLRDLARQEGLDPAFWRVGPGLLKVYADLGLTPLPLNKDGCIVVADEEPDPSRRYLVCVAERDLGALMPMLPELAGSPAE
jgi:hypothetical protein